MPVNPAATPSPPTPLTARPRLFSLDVMRGLTMAAMVVVNNPGSWGSVYPPLRHADWHGCTPTDLIFPFFLFVVGVAMAMPARSPAFSRVLRRTLWLFGLGLLLNASSSLVTGKFDPVEFRIMGVLQRIALCYFAASMVVRWTGLKTQVALAAAVLVGYGLVLTQWPAPAGPTPSHGDHSPAGSIVARLDRALLGSTHLYRGGPQDPEGLLSTLPAVVTVFAGLWSGKLVRRWISPPPRPGLNGLKALPLLAIGSILLGWAWARWGGLPLNKALWTSSFVLFTGGWAMIVFWLCVILMETQSPAHVRWVRNVAGPFQILGVNAIMLFVGSGLLSRVLGAIHLAGATGDIRLNAWIHERFFTWWLPPPAASLGFALTMLAFWWCVLWICWRREWILKV